MTATLNRIASDELNLRKVQNVVSQRTTPSQSTLSSAITGSSTISTISQIEQVEPVKYVYQRPKLEQATANLEEGESITISKFLTQAATVAESDASPKIKKAYQLLVIELHNMVEEVASRHLTHISKQIRADSAELEQLNIKKSEEICKHIREMGNDSTWSFFSNIMQYFLSAATIVLGGIMVGTGVGVVAGAFLIAAGGLGLLDRIAKDTGAYKAIAAYFSKSQQMQEQIASWIATTVLFVTIGLGITGGIMSSFSSGLDAARASLTAVDAAKKAEIAIGLATAGVAVGKANSENDTAQIKKALQQIEGRIFFMKEDLRRNGSEAKNTISMMQAITTQARQTVTAFR